MPQIFFSFYYQPCGLAGLTLTTDIKANQQWKECTVILVFRASKTPGANIFLTADAFLYTNLGWEGKSLPSIILYVSVGYSNIF